MKQVSVELITQALNDPSFSFIETFADASDSSKIQREMTILIFKNRQKREELQVRERERVIIENKYNKKKRDAYLKHSNAPNEKHRTILVEIDTEEEKLNLEVAEQRIRDLTRELSSIKLEIDTWKAISYNLRTEMGSF